MVPATATREFGAAGTQPARLQTQGDLRQAELLVQVLTWQEMDNHGVLTWLDRETWKARRDQLEKLGGPAIPSER